jgi:hypothetical protein
MKQDIKKGESVLSFENAISVEKLEERLEITELAAQGPSCTYECKPVDIPY